MSSKNLGSAKYFKIYDLIRSSHFFGHPVLTYFRPFMYPFSQISQPTSIPTFYETLKMPHRYFNDTRKIFSQHKTNSKSNLPSVRNSHDIPATLQKTSRTNTFLIRCCQISQTYYFTPLIYSHEYSTNVLYIKKVFILSNIPCLPYTYNLQKCLQ